MKQFMLYAACALLIWSVTAHPNFERRHDLVDDDEPFARDADSDFDLIAEESGNYETVVATELPPSPPTHSRGRVRFSTADKQEENHRYTSSNRYRSRKASTTATPISLTQEPVESEKDERALMLVLPYDTRNLSESKIQELYTKAPMTWIINTTTTIPPITKPQTERTSTTVVVTPTPEIKYYRKRITTTTTTQAPPPMRDNVKDVLASIGLFPDKQEWKPVTTTQAPEFVKIATDSFSPDMINLLASFGLMPSESKNEIPPPSAPEEPEQFDLPQTQPSFQAEIDPSSYSVFKPIPNTHNKHNKQALSSDMKEFLASFGIVDDDNMKKETRPRGKQLLARTEVTASPLEIPTLHPESMSDDMKNVLHSLGLVPHLTPEQITEKTTFQSRSINSEYIFNPTDSVHNSLNNSEDVENLKKLLDAFKSLASNTSTPEEIEKQLQEANLSQQNFTTIFGNNNNNNNDKHTLTLDKYTNAPDPLSFEELLYAINETTNEIHKRQEAKNTSDTTSGLPPSSTEGATTARPSTKSTTTTTEANEEPEESDSKNAASETNAEETSIGASSVTSTTENNAALLADLESSFGGNTGSSTIDEELPPARPNGFYFMLDWNSFLNVGEDDKGVNLKFAPRLGNSRNFLPITVP